MTQQDEIDIVKFRRDFEKACEHADLLLRTSLFALLVKQITPEQPEEASMLGAAILNEVLAEEPTNLEGQLYRSAHKELIALESRKLCKSAVTSEVCAYLYALQIIFTSYQMGSACALGNVPDALTKRNTEITNRSIELSLYIPNTYALCGSDDAVGSVVVICQYANSLIQSGII